MSKLESPESDIRKDKKVYVYYLLLGILIGFVIGSILALWYFMPENFWTAWKGVLMTYVWVATILIIILWYFFVRR